MSTSSQFCTFVVDGHYFGVEVERVQEVLRFQELTRVPLAPAVVSGLINLRGQIVTAVNLRQRLSLRERPAGQLPMSVILRSDDGAVSLLVDEIGEVLSAEGDMAEPPPETLRGVGRELIKGVYKLEGRLLLVLDAERGIQSSGGRFMNERKAHEGTQ